MRCTGPRRGAGSDQTPQHGEQAAALILGSDRDAQEVFDPGLLEVPHQHAALAKCCGEICAAMAAMTHEYEIRHGWQNLEAERSEAAAQRLAARHDALARL